MSKKKVLPKLPTSKKGRFFYAVLLVGIGIKGMWWVFTDTKMVIDSESWIQSNAIVTAVNINESRGTSSKMYSPRIVYQFKHNGEVQHGDRFTIPSKRYSSKNKVLNILSEYNIGNTINVYFDPESPQYSSATKPEINLFFTLFLGGLAIIMFVSGVILTIFTIKYNEPTNP